MRAYASWFATAVSAFLATALYAIPHGPDLAVSFAFEPSQFLPTFTADGEFSVDVSVINRGSRPGEDGVLTVDFDEAARIGAVTGDFDSCSIEGSRVTCLKQSIPVRPPVTAHIVFTTPPLYAGGTTKITARIESAGPDLHPANDSFTFTAHIVPTFVVSNTRDGGPGSLRQAITDFDTGCKSQCVIVFHIAEPKPASGFFTIRPRAPLPPLTATGTIDGGTWPPTVMLDGSMQPSGDGLAVVAHGVNNSIERIAIGNFQGPAIDVTLPPPQGNVDVYEAYLGLDPTGSAAPNERGMVASGLGSIGVSKSVIGSNRRSGLFLSVEEAYIFSNRIGVAPGSDAPMPNGASGLFFASIERGRVWNNVIANNPDFGIAAGTQLQSLLEISQNAIYSNGIDGIDYGLDGLSPNVADDSHRFPNHPLVTTATYDAASGTTRIDVQLDTRAGRPVITSECPGPECWLSQESASIEAYSNDAPNGQTQHYLGTLSLGNVPLTGSSSFTTSLTVPGDLSGKWISAIAIRSRRDCAYDFCDGGSETSEVSPSIAVQ